MYIIKNCQFQDICDCKATPAVSCPFKRAVEFCATEIDKNPRSEVRSHLQMGKIIVVNEIFKILNVEKV